MATPKDYRKFMKSDLWLEMEDMRSDQQNHVPHPPVQQPYPADADLIKLVPPAYITVGDLSVKQAILQRRSTRKFSSTPLTLEELSYLAWAAQGVHDIWREGIAVRRTVPSAGSRHPFETYLVINNVEDVKPGLYRYLGIEHALLFMRSEADLANKTAMACHNQRWVSKSAVVFVWTAIPYRTEWRYALMTPKLVNLDAGHVCHSLYLAAESIGAGTCAIAAYMQKEMDALLGVDGENEFAVYVAPVGKKD